MVCAVASSETLTSGESLASSESFARFDAEGYLTCRARRTFHHDSKVSLKIRNGHVGLGGKLRDCTVSGRFQFGNDGF